MSRIGRPTKYTEDMPQKVDEYLDKIENQVLRLAMIEDFALSIGVHKDTVYEWEKKHEAFSDALDKLRAYQKIQLVNNGLSGVYNSTIDKLMLMNNHGFVDKKETDLTSGNKPLAPQVVVYGDTDRLNNQINKEDEATV